MSNRNVPAPPTELPEYKKFINIIVEISKHNHMRELARRRKLYISEVYEQAVEYYLRLPMNYLGAKHEK